MYNNFTRTLKKSINKVKYDEEQRAKQELEKQELEKQASTSAEKDDTKKIYLIAGAVAVLGAVIIIIKTRKK
jgi:hypothetical protein